MLRRMGEKTGLIYPREIDPNTGLPVSELGPINADDKTIINEATDHDKVLQLILDIGAEMMSSGAEVGRVEGSVRRMCMAHGFEKINIWVVTSSIQATVRTKDGQIFTQIRETDGSGLNFRKLDRLNALSRYICYADPSPDDAKQRLREIKKTPAPGLAYRLFAGMLAGGAFAVFFAGDRYDCFAAALAGIIAVLAGEVVGRNETNPMIYNSIVGFLVECFILLTVFVGIGHHTASITSGIIMLLVSALQTMKGVRDLLRRDVLSGIITVTYSLLGATGVAIGIVLAMLLGQWLGSFL